MKTSTLLSVLSATAAGAALAYAANSTLLALSTSQFLLAAFAVGGLAAIFSADYRRQFAPLTPRAPVVRPAAAAIAFARTTRSNAYGIRPRHAALIERSAA